MFFRNFYQFLHSDSVDTGVIKFFRFFLLGGALILFAWFVYFSFCTITIPYQIEYREGVAQVMTQILLTGGNPFSLEYQPLGMNNYGIGYNIIALPFAKLFGNTLAVHRSISVFFLLSSLFFVARIVFALKKDILTSILCGILIVTGLAGRGGLGAVPSAMGAFLFLAAILIPFIYSFGYHSLIASALLSLMAYYTKPYFVICVGVVAVYTFAFVSKKKGVVYSLFFLSAFSLLFLGVRYGLKLYFIDTLISNLSNASRSQDHLRVQLLELVAEFYPSLLLGVALLLSGKPGSLQRNLFRKDLLSQSDFLHADAPFLDLPINYFAFTFFSCFLGFVSVLGLHQGNYMTYAYQIVLPPFILWLFQTLNSKGMFSTIALGLLIGNVLILDNILLNPSFLRQRDSIEWADLRNLIRNSRRIANSPAVVSILMDTGILPIDSGQTEYYYDIKPYPDNKLFGPSYNTIKANGTTYRQSIRNAIRSHQFDNIILTDGYPNLVSLDTVSQYYKKVKTITIDMPQTHQTWVIGIWEPISK